MNYAKISVMLFTFCLFPTRSNIDDHIVGTCWSMGSMFLKGQERYENVRNRSKCHLLIQIPHCPNSPWLWPSLSNRSGPPVHCWFYESLGHILSYQWVWWLTVSLASPSKMLTTFHEARVRLYTTLTVSVARLSSLGTFKSADKRNVHSIL